MHLTQLSTTAEVLFGFALVWCFFWAFMASRSRVLLLVMAALSAVHYGLAARGFYTNNMAVPPTQMLLLAPTVITLLLLVALPAGRRWLRGLDLVSLVMLNVLRIPVELVLHESYLTGLVPRGMTYSGHNFDLFSGLSAALVAAWLLSRRPPSRSILITWNLICLTLLAIVVVTAVGSMPTAVQRWNLDQPAVLVLQVPYVLLPAVLVPAVLWSHLAMLVQLLGRTPSGAR